MVISIPDKEDTSTSTEFDQIESEFDLIGFKDVVWEQAQHLGTCRTIWISLKVTSHKV